jgi:hypothetical protein
MFPENVLLFVKTPINGMWKRIFFGADGSALGSVG